MRELVVPAGERRRVLRTNLSSIPQTFSLVTEPLSGELGGTVEIHGSRWVFRKPPVTLPLRSVMEVRRGYWDTLFSVYVIPETDVRVVVRRGRADR